MSIRSVEAQIAEIPFLAFNPVGPIEQPAIGRLQVSLADIAQKITNELEEIVLDVIKSPTIEDFYLLRKEIFPSYMKLSLGLSNVVLAKLATSDLPGVLEGSLSIMEGEVANYEGAYFGDEARHEILFSISTMKSAYRLIPHLLTNDVSENARQEDMALARAFTSAAAWASFHLQGTMIAIRRDVAIIPEILQELLEGLRLSVMMYANVRAGLELRNIPDSRYRDELVVTWDTED